MPVPGLKIDIELFPGSVFAHFFETDLLAKSPLVSRIDKLRTLRTAANFDLDQSHAQSPPFGILIFWSDSSFLELNKK
jgi:hypothetical protein